MDYSKLYIDPDISLNALLKKIETESADKLVIIVHQQSSIFTGQVNIELIKKYAQKADKKLIFITQIEEVKNLLSECGCKVYSNLEQFESQAVNGEKQEVKSQNFSPSIQKNQYLGIIKTFFSILLLVLILGGAWFYFLFPRVTIQVDPVVKNKTVVNQVRGKYKTDKISFNQRTLPLIKKRVKLAKEIKVPATGQKRVGVSRSSGKITFINNQQQPVVIPAGALVRTVKGIKFRTLHQIKVPAAEVDKLVNKVVGSKSGKATVKIEAVHKGKKGNVAEGKITNWGAKSYPVELVNSSPTTGGRDKIMKVATKQDLLRGEKVGKERLIEQARKKLKDEFSKQQIFFDQQVKFIDQNFTPQTEANTAANQVSISGNIEAIGFGVEKEGLKELVFNLYKRNLAAQFKLRNEQITIKGIEVVNANQNQVVFKVKSKGRVVGKVDKNQIIQQIIGKEVSAAKQLLNQLATIEKYEIKPANQVNLPDFKFGLDLVVEGTNNEE